MKQFATALAKKAGAYLKKNFKKDVLLQAARGMAKEITTKYDKGSDKLIIQTISRKFPWHNLLTEESGFMNKNSSYTWIVDSLDGSSNFARGNPFFAVSIAVMEKEKLLLGLIYAPMLDELYVAERGKGAFLNGKKIYGSSVRDLKYGYLVSCEGGEKTNTRISAINRMFHPQVKDLRKLGSASLEAASVACGRADAYIVTEIAPWDVAAGVLLIEEAGGKVTTFAGRRWSLKKNDLVFSNGKIHAQIIKQLPL